MEKEKVLKIYDEWNEEKKEVNFDERDFYVNVREIWFTKMGQNIGFEENGKFKENNENNFLRPVLVLKKVGNLFFTVALTSKGATKSNSKFYYKLNDVHFNEDNKKYKNSSYIILSQVKVMDKKRFTEHMGTVSEKEFNLIQKKLKTLLF